MKYRDILHFDPITDVVQFAKLSDADYQRQLVRTFVFSDYFLDALLPEVVRNLRFGEKNQFGLQIIGNYGTGKSHLMSLIQLVATHEDYLADVGDPAARETLAPIAGLYLAHSFELGSSMDLWNVLTYQLQKFLDQNQVPYRFEPNTPKTYREQLDEMMAAFESVFPDKGFLLVIDEMLSYLKGRVHTGQLAQDLQVLQALGQCCDGTRFSFMFGVQEMIYSATEFRFAADMLLKVKDRYRDLTIRKEDVDFVVKQRLLRKSDQQRKAIAEHLRPFEKFYTDLGGHFNDFVDLFPVHPSYIENFQKIRKGKAQREILKTLSARFAEMMDQDIPTKEPGLITYDDYWNRIQSDSSLQSIPEFRTVKEKMAMVYDKIETNFEEQHARLKPLARRIANACAIKLLQDDLDKRNGVRPETLVDDLCCTATLMKDRQLLVDQVRVCCERIKRATSGQYFDYDEERGEYHLRTEDTVNIDELIAQYADTLSPVSKDKAFFQFLEQMLSLADPYRTGFKIYAHELEWRSHKVKRDGYIFMGSSNEKSTTQPKQHFYMMFMPIFDTEHLFMSREPDELYFLFDGLGDEFRRQVVLYGAAYSLVDSHPGLRQQFIDKQNELFKRARRAFAPAYLEKARVVHGKGEPRPIADFHLPPEGASHMEVFDAVASDIFESQFQAETPHYPSFSREHYPVTSANRQRYINGALAKIARPKDSNRDGEAVLTALGLYSGGELNADHSLYAQHILQLMAQRDAKQVVNRDELLYVVPNSNNSLWLSKDCNIEACYQFVVIAALVALGECDLRMGDGTDINATNIGLVTRLRPEDYFDFASLQRPRGINLPVVKEITKAFCGHDLSNRLDDESTYEQLVAAAKREAAATATFLSRHLGRGAIMVADVELMGEGDVMRLNHRAVAYKNFCDKLSTYTSRARLKNLPYDSKTVADLLATKSDLEALRGKIDISQRLDSQVVYLRQALQYVASESDLHHQLSAAADRISAVLSAPNEAQVRQYEAELAEAKRQYTDYFLQRYHAFCLSDIDAQKLTALLNSEHYKVCDILADSPILPTFQWVNLRQQLRSFKPADPNVRRSLDTSPYAANFNPLANPQRMDSLLELGQQVEDIYLDWIGRIHDYLASDDIQQALKLQGQEYNDYANAFLQGLDPIENEYKAKTMLHFIDDLSKGFEKVDISLDNIRQSFSKPMSYDEAMESFRSLLNKLCHGKDKKKIRIVLN